jgi:hypothetical protein
MKTQTRKEINALLLSGIGRICEIAWLDPKIEIRTTFDKFLKEGFAKFKTNGRLVHVKGNVVILEHETIDDDEDRDLTMLHKLLVVDVNIIEKSGREDGASADITSSTAGGSVSKSV